MTQHDPKRRVFISRALVLGGTFALPGVLSACGNRDSEAHAGASDPAAGNRSAGGPAGIEDGDKPVQDPPPTPAGNKITKTQAKYQDQPNGEEKCADCAHFLADSKTCKLVDGVIAPEGWCQLWVSNG